MTLRREQGQGAAMRTPVEESGPFLDRLAESRLLSVDEVQAVRALATRVGDDKGPQALADHLVKEGKLTDWQARCLRGGERPFFVGEYKLLDVLSDEGGMGVVYLAEQPRLGRRVALKVIKPEGLGDDIIRKRFDEEVRALASLNHPNIVSLYDAGTDDAGLPFLVMEHIVGENLEDCLREGQLPDVARACALVRQAALALQHAHKRGQIHRDIKPGNLMVTRPTDREIVLKVLDFGLAREVERAPGKPALTRPGAALGTPDYCAPEQLGTTGRVDIRADIYSLGCVFFELLTGRKPFEGAYLRRLNEEAPRLETIRPDLPARLATILAKMLPREPEMRYQTPEELADDLGRFGDPAPAEAGPSSGLPCRCFVRRLDGTPDFLQALAEHSKLVFLGISHRQLPTEYLREVLDRAHGPLPWRSIEVYYARDNVGKVFEGDNFLPNLRQSRQAVMELLFGRADRVPHLEEVIFRQSFQPRVQTGCLLGEEGQFSPDFRTAYYISGLAPQIPDESPTFRVNVGDADESARQDITGCLKAAYKTIRDSSDALGTFRPSVWDSSVGEWSRFCNESEVQKSSMQALVDFAGFRDNEAVLELAAGSGHLSAILWETLATVPGARLTLQEASPLMLRNCKDILKEKVRYALCYIPMTDERESIDIFGEKFNVIVVHLTLTAMIGDAGTRGLAHLAGWCSKYLHPGGRVILSAHNTAVKVETPGKYDPDRDAFRSNLRRLAKEMRIADHFRVPFRPFSPDDVITAFESRRFTHLRSQTRHFTMSREDRFRMWRVPAILDTFVDVKKVGIEMARELVERAITASPQVPEDARTVAYWSFVGK